MTLFGNRVTKYYHTVKYYHTTKITNEKKEELNTHYLRGNPLPNKGESHG